MRAFLLLSQFLPFIFSAQILNPGFESVTSGKPNNWNLPLYGYNTYQIKDTSDSHTGSHAAYIRGLSNTSYSVQGAVLGTFSVTGKPSSLNGWYKCNIVSGDSLCFAPYVYQTNTFGASARGYTFTTTSTNVYKQFSSVIDYSVYPGSNCDTLFVSIYLSGINTDGQGVNIPQTGTWAIIDDLTLGIPASVPENTAINRIEKIGPNPNYGNFMVYFSISNATNCSMYITDINGKKVLTAFENERLETGNYRNEFDISKLASGIYFVGFSTDGIKHSEKLIKQ